MKETDRLKALEEYKILDTLPEKEFNDIVDLASAICNTPISLITLLDTKRQWFKAKKGLEIDETKREYAFCHYAIQTPSEVTVVPDAVLDDRFKVNPLVTGSPDIRFYAGAPLITKDNYILGTLCVIDSKPRNFSKEQKRMLQVLADRVINLLELRKESIKQGNQLNETQQNLELMVDRLIEAQHTAQIGSWDWDIKTGKFYWSPEMYNIFGFDKSINEPVTYETWQSLIHPADVDVVRASIKNGLKNHTPGTVEYRVKRKDEKEIWILGKGKVSVNDKGEVTRINGTALNITERKKAEADRLLYLKTLEEMLFNLSHKIRRPVASYLGLINAMESEEFSVEKLKKYLNYFKISANEFDTFIHEMNEFIVKNKTTITGKSNDVD